MFKSARFDAPFWALLSAGVLAVGVIGCFSFALEIQTVHQLDAPIMSTSTPRVERSPAVVERASFVSTLTDPGTVDGVSARAEIR